MSSGVKSLCDIISSYFEKDIEIDDFLKTRRDEFKDNTGITYDISWCIRQILIVVKSDVRFRRNFLKLIDKANKENRLYGVIGYIIETVKREMDIQNASAILEEMRDNYFLLNTLVRGENGKNEDLYDDFKLFEHYIRSVELNKNLRNVVRYLTPELNQGTIHGF